MPKWYSAILSCLPTGCCLSSFQQIKFNQFRNQSPQWRSLDACWIVVFFFHFANVWLTFELCVAPELPSSVSQLGNQHSKHQHHQQPVASSRRLIGFIDLNYLGTSCSRTVEMPLVVSLISPLTMSVGWLIWTILFTLWWLSCLLIALTVVVGWRRCVYNTNLWCPAGATIGVPPDSFWIGGDGVSNGGDEGGEIMSRL